jgi:hypothetical protein
MSDELNPPDRPAAERRDPSLPDASDEPFPCPHCGQMLAPTCRVCVACRQAINPADIRRTPPVEWPSIPGGDIKSPRQAEAPSPPTLPPVRYPWRMLLLVLALTWIGAVAALGWLGLDRGRILVSNASAVVQMLSSLWVYFDARQKRLPKPLHWGLGTLFLWIIVFPWYLVRRRTPEAPCPFVEREASPLARVLLAALALFFMVVLVVAVLHGPK